MLLIDAGCEWENYASDITRTIPIGNGGKYTKEAGEIYELVLRMQKVRKGATCSKQPHSALIRTGMRGARIPWDTLGYDPSPRTQGAR
jgi:Xaa-Pro dipeptidase